MKRNPGSASAARPRLMLLPIVLFALCSLVSCEELAMLFEAEDEPKAKPRLSIQDARVSEGHTGTSHAAFSVRLSASSSRRVTVSYRTSDRTATAGTDYRAASGTLTFSAGQTSKRISVTVTGDRLVEEDELFTVTLSSPSNATISDATATGTISNDDAVIRDCDVCPEMVEVPAGSFTMGAPPTEEGSEEDERPVRQVTISAPFAVGLYEVTFAEWDACVADGGCGARPPDDAGWGRGSRPVIDISWDDARAYVAWLSRKSGKQYRLLTEEEWEYVARAGTTTPFHTGATISTDQANYDGRSSYASGQTGPYRERTLAAGSLARNEFGLYDVHGNVAEWVADCYEQEAGGTCEKRVVRGGSWANGADSVRSAYRGWCNPTLRNDRNGLRVARSL